MIGIESPIPAPPPQRQLLVSTLALQLRRGFDQQPKDSCPIVIDQFDDPGLHDQPAKLDQIPRSLAPLHLPVPPVMTRL